MENKYLCPECSEVAIFDPVGPYRSKCRTCSALVKNEELEETVKEI